MVKSGDVHKAVERKLRHDPLVAAADIVVSNIDGIVALTGTVPSYPQYLEAARAARRVPGVNHVRNHLEVVLPPADRRDDATLTDAAKEALAASASVPEGVEAVAKDGNVTLTGSVQYGSQRTAAESAVTGLTGVRNVQDHIEVVFDVDQPNAKHLVMKALDRYGLAHRAVAVEVRGGNTVILVGQVRTQEERDAVVGAAWLAPGVMAVVDEIQVTG